MPTRQSWAAFNRDMFQTSRYGGRSRSWQEWHDREFRKQPTRRLLVWCDEVWWRTAAAIEIHKYQFPHGSDVDPMMIAFTKNDADGERDIQTRARPGRYLTKYFSDVLSEKQIAFWAAEQAKGEPAAPTYDDYELKFASDPKEIVWVYQHGPRSCMDERSFRYIWNHPCQVYGAGDLAIAYLERRSEDAEKIVENITISEAMDRKRVEANARIKARALVWPENKVMGRVYPTPEFWREDGFADDNGSRECQEALKLRLMKDGYKSVLDGKATFDGARLLKIPRRNSKNGEVRENEFLVPYLDNNYGIDDGGDCLIMRPYGKARYSSGGTNGVGYIAPSHAMRRAGEARAAPPAAITRVATAAPADADESVIDQSIFDAARHDPGAATALYHARVMAERVRREDPRQANTNNGWPWARLVGHFYHMFMQERRAIWFCFDGSPIETHIGGELVLAAPTEETVVTSPREREAARVAREVTDRIVVVGEACGWSYEGLVAEHTRRLMRPSGETTWAVPRHIDPGGIWRVHLAPEFMEPWAAVRGAPDRDPVLVAGEPTETMPVWTWPLRQWASCASATQCADLENAAISVGRAVRGTMNAALRHWRERNGIRPAYIGLSADNWWMAMGETGLEMSRAPAMRGMVAGDDTHGGVSPREVDAPEYVEGIDAGMLETERGREAAVLASEMVREARARGETFGTREMVRECWRGLMGGDTYRWILPMSLGGGHVERRLGGSLNLGDATPRTNAEDLVPAPVVSAEMVDTVGRIAEARRAVERWVGSPGAAPPVPPGMEFTDRVRINSAGRVDILLRRSYYPSASHDIREDAVVVDNEGCGATPGVPSTLTMAVEHDRIVPDTNVSGAPAGAPVTRRRSRRTSHAAPRTPASAAAASTDAQPQPTEGAE